MEFKRLSIGQLGSMYSDTTIIDRFTNQLIYFSAISYTSLMQKSLQELKKPNSYFFLSSTGSFKRAKKGYEVETKKDTNSDFVHCIAYAKDNIDYKEDGTEEITIYVYAKDKDDATNKIFAKLIKYSSIPILEEWKDYIVNELMNYGSINELLIYTGFDNPPFNAYKVYFNKDIIKNIVTEGLSSKTINIKNSNEPSQILENINGLNDYLNSFGEILAEKIQTAFRPKFVPGEDKYDLYTDYIDDYIYHEANIELYEAQKSVIQAITNDLKVNNVSFLIAEMGSGKTTMGAAIPYVHHANRDIGYNVVVVCPSHLVNVWNREIEERIPNAKAYIIHDFKELKELEPKLRNKNKIENSYIILSKERAKMNYEKRPAAIWSRSKNTFICPECGQILYTKVFEGRGRYRTENHIPFNELSMTKQLAINSKCMNTIRKWNAKKHIFEDVKCNTPLWTPVNKNDTNHKWFKLGSEGWIQKEHIVSLTENLMSKESLNKKENALFTKLMEQYELIQVGEEPYSPYNGVRRYSIAKYIRERMYNVFDYCIVD